MNEYFGYPKYNEKNEMILTTYTNEYKNMLMDVRLYQLEAKQELEFMRPEEEMAILLLSGSIEFHYENQSKRSSRASVFEEGPTCLHVCHSTNVKLVANKKSEILVQCTLNNNNFAPEYYSADDVPWAYSSLGKFGGVAQRRVNTIFDKDISPNSNMVLGEVLNDKGNWSGYLPHAHPQPELYFFKFDRPEGFGASFVGDYVFKSIDNSFSAIPGGMAHPQVCAPGFQMYTTWMIRHLDKSVWTQKDRNEDPRYIWLHEVE